MKAGGGVWHDGGPLPGDPLRLFQLWVALSADQELAPAESHYIAAESVGQEGAVSGILCELRRERSLSPRTPSIKYFQGRRNDRERPSYPPPATPDMGALR